MIRIAGVLLGLWALGNAVADDWVAQRAEVLKLAELTERPVLRDVRGRSCKLAPGELKQVYFDALKYEGKATRVFAWMGMPKSAKAAVPVPGMVLVHGGGGSAFKTWVEKWNARGYAAISIAVEGQNDVRSTAEEKKKGFHWQRHAWPGPHRHGIYGDSNKPLKEQWMYHAVAQTILANSLMRSLPEVADDQVGLMGISWGGIITSTVMGIDQRFAFAIPTYGCGNLAETANQYGKALGNNQVYRKVWDPMVRMKYATMPAMWFSWPGDKHFPLDDQAVNYRTAPGARMVVLVPGMRHGHGPGWTLPDSYAFADSVLQREKPWPRVDKPVLQDRQAHVTITSDKKLDGASLVWTSDTGHTGSRKWEQTAAKLSGGDHNWTATVTVPENATGWFVNVRSAGLTVSSDFQGK
jgi:dienelactone hydrolase